MFYFGSLFYISLFSNSPVFSPSPPSDTPPQTAHHFIVAAGRALPSCNPPARAALATATTAPLRPQAGAAQLPALLQHHGWMLGAVVAWQKINLTHGSC